MVRFAGTEAENVTAEAMKKAWEAICNIWQASHALDEHDTEDGTFRDEGNDANVPQNLIDAFLYLVAALEKFTCTIVYDIIGHTYNPLHHELDPADPEAQQYGNQPLSSALCEATVVEVVKPGFRVSGRLSFRTVVRVSLPSTPAGARAPAGGAAALHPRRPLPFLVTGPRSAVEVTGAGHTAFTTSTSSPLGQRCADTAVDRAAAAAAASDCVAAAASDYTTASDEAASACVSVSAADMDDTDLSDLSLLIKCSAEQDQCDVEHHSAEGAGHEAKAHGSAGDCGEASTVSAAGVEPRRPFELLLKYRPCDARGPPPVPGDGAEVTSESQSAAAAAIAATTSVSQQAVCPARPRPEPQGWSGNASGGAAPFFRGPDAAYGNVSLSASAFGPLEPGVQGFFSGPGFAVGGGNDHYGSLNQLYGSGGHTTASAVAHPGAFCGAHVPQPPPPFVAPLPPLSALTTGLRIVTNLPTKDAATSLPYGGASGSPAARRAGPVGSPGPLAGSGSPGPLATHASTSPLSSSAVPVLLALERASTAPFIMATWRPGQDDGNIGGRAASGGVLGRTSSNVSAVQPQSPLAPAVADRVVAGPSLQPAAAGPVSNGAMNPPAAAGRASAASEGGVAYTSGGPQGASGPKGASGAKPTSALGMSNVPAAAAAAAAAAVKRAAAAAAATTAARPGAAAKSTAQTGPRAPPPRGSTAAPNADGSTAAAAPVPPCAPPPAVAASTACGAPQQPAAASTSAGATPAAAARPEPLGSRRDDVWPEYQPQPQSQSQAPNGFTVPAAPAARTVQPAVAAAPSAPLAAQLHPYGSTEAAPARYQQHPAWADFSGGVRFAAGLEEVPDRPSAPQRSKSAPRPTRPSMPAGRQIQPPYQGPIRGRPGPGPGPYLSTGERGEKAQVSGSSWQRQPGPEPGSRCPEPRYAQQPAPHRMSYMWGDQGPQQPYRTYSYYEMYKQKRGEPARDQLPERADQNMPYGTCPQYPPREHYERYPRGSDVQRQQAAYSSQAASSERTASSTGSASDMPAPPASAAGASSASEKRRQQPDSGGDAASTSADTDGDGDSGSARLDADGGGEYGHAHDGCDDELYNGAGGPGRGRGGRGGFVPRGRGRGGRRGGGRGSWGYGGHMGGRYMSRNGT